MKSFTVAALLMVSAAPVCAQTPFTIGEKVEVLNAITGEWDPVTVTAVSGLRADQEYTIHSSDAGVFDRTVGEGILRTSGGAVRVAHLVAPAADVSAMTDGVPNASGSQAAGSVWMNGNGTLADGTNPLARFTPAKPYDAESEPINDSTDASNAPLSGAAAR